MELTETEDVDVKIEMKYHHHALYCGKDNILISSIGSRETIITYMILLMLRSLWGASNGVVIHILPLNTIIEEKISIAPLKSACILMSGKA